MMNAPNDMKVRFPDGTRNSLTGIVPHLLAPMVLILASGYAMAATDAWLNDRDRDALASAAILDIEAASGLDFGVRPGQEETASDLPLMVAAAELPAETESSDNSDSKETSAECAAFAKDNNADLGEVLEAGCKPTLAQMSALMDNPVGNVAMLFTQFDLTKLENPDTDKKANKGVYMGIAQFPKGLNEDWNLINRVIWTVPSVPLDQDKVDNFGSGPGGSITPPTGGAPLPIDLFDGRTTGFGDLYYVGLFSPKKPVELDNGAKAVWGLGFDLGLPTASDDLLGTGKWTAGPSALAVYLGPKWKVGALAQHYWDFAGDDDRDDVNLSNIQTLYYYSLNSTTSIGAGPNVIANWEQSSGNKWTVPIGIGINKTIKIGNVPVRFGAEIHYSVIQPDDVPGADWNLRFFMIPSAPSAMFGWMK